MKRALLWGAGIAVVATALTGALALVGVPKLPVAEYLLFPGSMLAWLYKGDNYASSQEFIMHALAFGLPVNAVLGSIFGSFWAAGRQLFAKSELPVAHNEKAL